MAAIGEQIKKGWKGAVIGGIVGFFTGKFLVSSQDVQSLFSPQSLFDTTIGVVQTSTKSAIIFALIGAVVGLFLQINKDEIKRLFR